MEPTNNNGDKGALLRELRIDPGQRERPSPMGGRGWIVAVIVLLCLLVAGAAYYLLFQHRAIEVQSVTAVTPTAADQGATSVLQATGYVTARRQATVSAQITGALTQVLIEEGEQVKAGQILARLEDTAQRAGVAQAQAQLNAAGALRMQYQAQLEQARRDLKRAQDELAVDAVSRQSVEQAQTQVDTLTAQVMAQQRQTELAQAQLDGQRVQLDYTVVRAPFSGVITAKAAQAGEIVSPISAGGGFTRTGVGTIVDMDSLEFEVDVNEAYIHRVAPNQKAEAVLDAYPDWKIPAHVIAIIPTADRSKATVKVRVGIDQHDPRILPDMGVRISFLEEATPANEASALRGVLIPRACIIERDGRPIVFTIENGRAHQHAVQPGVVRGELQQVEGIANGARVVRSPPESLHDDAAVTIAKE
ncbi:MAG TPA: efflux RND transporter periplasmic adaptor subunit [Steroidobacteraceae bacterium]|jgi:RND family efflux transporter MFP subunit|nr:efflux RND transporter periplasmic adaptor subunit [Steroidobacteraceae bacterium]